MIKNCLLCGKESLNGYKFSQNAFGAKDNDKVKKLYEGKLVFINHTERGKHPLQRGVEEFAGEVTNARFDAEGRPRGDIETADAPKGELLRTLAKRKYKQIGLSHSAQYRFSKDRTQVESIEDVYSVDVVVNPATTKSFWENVQTPEESKTLAVEKENENLEKLVKAQEEIKSLNAKIEAAEKRATEAENKVATFKTQLETVQTELSGLKAEKEAVEKRESLIKTLKEKGIKTDDADICPEHFIEALLVCNETVREGLIKDKLAAIEAGKAKPGSTVVTKERKAGGNNEAFDPKKVLEGNIFA